MEVVQTAPAGSVLWKTRIPDGSAVEEGDVAVPEVPALEVCRAMEGWESRSNSTTQVQRNLVKGARQWLKIPPPSAPPSLNDTITRPDHQPPAVLLCSTVGGPD